MEISETMKAQQSRTTGASLTWTTKGLSGVHVRDMELSLTKGSTGIYFDKKIFRKASHITAVYLTCNFSPVCIALFTFN